MQDNFLNRNNPFYVDFAWGNQFAKQWRARFKTQSTIEADNPYSRFVVQCATTLSDSLHEFRRMKEFCNIWVGRCPFARSLARCIYIKRVRKEDPFCPEIDLPTSVSHEKENGGWHRGALPPRHATVAHVLDRGSTEAEELPRELRTILHKSRDTPSYQNLGEILE